MEFYEFDHQIHENLKGAQSLVPISKYQQHTPTDVKHQRLS